MKRLVLILVLLAGILGFASAGFCADEALVVDENGNVGIGVTNPSAKLDVGGLLTADTENGVVQTSQYVKEFSGRIDGPGNYPTCDDPAKIVKIGKIEDSSDRSFITIELFGSHRGYQNTGYFDYKKWVVMAGDKLSSNIVSSAGGNNKVNIFDGTSEGNYTNIEIGAGFDIKLKVNPQCGSNMKYSYIVKYYSGANFTPDPKRIW